MMEIELLVVTGSLCLILALIEAWLLVAVFAKPESSIAKWIPGVKDLLKSHIDYLLMSLFLFVFYMLFSHFQVQFSPFFIFCMCIGSLGNPALFLIRAMKPSLELEPTALFQATMTTSCILTTIGYFVGSCLVASAAIVTLS